MKLILYPFEQFSGLKKNFHKSEIFCFGEAKDCENQYMELFGCNQGAFPIRYLGIPIHYRRLSNKDWLKVQSGLKTVPIAGKAKIFPLEAI